ncbi:MAG: mycothiol conjugate amidase Mca [Acidimicrobiales bacterium]
MPELSLLTVHAHPDDEASKGPATVAKYRAQGVRTTLVTCTGGEEGDILNPAMDTPGAKERIAELRRQELEDAAAVIGYHELVWLGYRDSGMPDSPANAGARSFARAPLDEAVGRLVAVIRRVRPQVVVTYPADQSGYPHPDHLRVHDISLHAFDAAADPDRYPEAGDPWAPARLYANGWSAQRMRAIHDKFIELGLESPFEGERLSRLLAAPEEPAADAVPPTRVDVTGYTEVRRLGLLAHRTQVDPSSPHWFGLPPEVADGIYPVDDYELLRSRVTPAGDGGTDLFADLRDDEQSADGSEAGDSRVAGARM